MIEIDLIQGTEEWHKWRMEVFTASDAPAMLGVSKHKTRTQLLNEKLTGVRDEEPGEFQEKLFANGHAIEEFARERVCDKLGEDFYPGIGQQEGGKLAASFDGITVCDSIIFEHKMMNQILREVENAENLPDMYKAQVQQQLMVSGAECCYFVASDWDEEGRCLEWKQWKIEPDGEWFVRIEQGWQQFEEDLQNHVVAEKEKVHKVDYKEQLPNLQVVLTGGVRESNIELFQTVAKQALEGINTTLETDEDFAQAKADVKWVKQVEKKLDSTKEMAMSQTISISKLFNTIDDIKEEFRQTRLMLEKTVKTEEASRKREMVEQTAQEFERFFNEQTRELNLGLICPKVNFSTAIFNLKTLSSMRDGLGTMLAEEKIKLRNYLDNIKKNYGWFKENTPEFRVPDLVVLLEKEPEAFIAILQQRVKQHNDQVEARARELAEQAEKKRLLQQQMEEKAAKQKAEAEAAKQRHQVQAPPVAPSVPVLNNDTGVVSTRVTHKQQLTDDFYMALGGLVAAITEEEILEFFQNPMQLKNRDEAQAIVECYGGFAGFRDVIFALLKGWK